MSLLLTSLLSIIQSSTKIFKLYLFAAETKDEFFHKHAII